MLVSRSSHVARSSARASSHVSRGASSRGASFLGASFLVKPLNVRSTPSAAAQGSPSVDAQEDVLEVECDSDDAEEMCLGDVPLGPSIVGGVPVETRTQVLSEALPYLQKFRKKTIVVKYGGAAMKDPKLQDGVIRDVALLATVGVQVVLVHGGGPEINSWLDKLQIPVQFHNGLRVTDDATMDVVEMVLTGRVNKNLVSLVCQNGGSAVGISGKDSKLLVARRHSDTALGRVGEVSSVRAELLSDLVNAGHIPVVATVATCEQDGGALNINGDTAAGAIASALKAEKLILMTDVPGVMQDKDDVSTLYRELDVEQANILERDGIIAGGMIPKVQCCKDSLAAGVAASHIIDGRQPHSLLQELLTAEGVGTMITP
ncbi:acetylglutamate kinase [Pycnococcus provasolii]